MTKADNDLVKQSPRQVHILSLAELQLTGPYVEFICTGSSSIALEIRMHECFFKSLNKWSSKRAHLISSHVYLRVCAGALVLFGHVFQLQYHHAVDIFLGLFVPESFVSMDNACAAKCRYWLDCEM